MALITLITFTLMFIYCGAIYLLGHDIEIDIFMVTLRFVVIHCT